MPYQARQYLPQEVCGWVLQDGMQHFDRETVFDYVAGEGQIYCAYDFRELLVGHYVKPRALALCAEIFDMGGPEDAYGVFSYCREEESQGIGVAYQHCGSFLCFWKDRFYTCVLSGESASESQEAAVTLARGIARAMPPSSSRPALVEALPREGLIPSSERYFHIHTILNHHYRVAEENVLRLSPRTNAVLARYEPEPTHLLCVQYPSQEEAVQAQESFLSRCLSGARDRSRRRTASGIPVALRRERGFLLLALDAPAEAPAGEMCEAMARRLRV